MKKMLLFSMTTLFAVGTSLSAYSLSMSQQDKDLLETAQGVFKPLPKQLPSPKDNPSTPAKIKLGKKLYFEKKLSMDNTLSCNSCHLLENYGTDNKPTSTGFKNQLGGRNAPSVYNSGLHFVQFWDGRAKDLEAQAGGPILNPVEMAMPNEKEVLNRLSKDKEYPKMFEEVFGKNAITYKNLTKAIAAFERTLITPSKFDKYLAGDVKALNADEKQGLRTFVEKGCITCHNGVGVGAGMYQKFGLVSPYQYQKDEGRFEVTKNPADKFVFKVPSLRNISETAPYFHDGKVKTLKEAIKVMGKTQLGLKITDKEASSIETFLKTLTGTKPKY